MKEFSSDNRPKTTLVNWIIILLLILIIFSGTFFTSDLFINEENDIKTYSVIILILLLLLLCSILRYDIFKFINLIRSSFFIFWIHVVSITLCIQGFIQYFDFIPTRHSSFSITGSFENPAGYVSVLVILFPTIFSTYLRNRNSFSKRVFSIITASLIITITVLSQSRTGILSLFIASTIILFYHTNLISYLNCHKWIYILFLLITPIAIYFLFISKIDSSNGRLFVWKICLNMIMDKPFFGFGINGFNSNYMEYQADFFFANPNSKYSILADNIAHPFNEFILIAIKYGLCGLLVILFCMYLIIRFSLKKSPYQKSLIISTIVSICILCSFSYPFEYAINWFLLSLLLLNVIDFKSIYKTKKRCLFAQICWCIMLLYSLFLCCFNVFYDTKWKEIQELSIKGYTTQMIPYYEKMKPHKKSDYRFLYNYSAELNIAGKYEESLVEINDYIEIFNDYDVQLLIADNYLNLDSTEKALESFKYASKMIPCRFIPLHCIQNQYMSLGDTLSAIQTAKEIISKPIKIKSSMIESIQEYAKLFVDKYDIKNY